MCHKKEIDDIKKQNDVLEQESKFIVEGYPLYINRIVYGICTDIVAAKTTARKYSPRTLR